MPTFVSVMLCILGEYGIPYGQDIVKIITPLVFRVTAPHKSVLFLGDLGPEGGDVLYEESRHLLQADIVQMAHHGHMNVSMEVYAAIRPRACMWCAPAWLYAEGEAPHTSPTVKSCAAWAERGCTAPPSPAAGWIF